jgi:hypothetical protein
LTGARCPEGLLTGPGGRLLVADCGSCLGLCCVATAFAASAGFALDKPAGRPCPHLGRHHRCAIHDELAGRGFPGCAAFDCLGAGQRTCRETFPTGTWRRDPDTAAGMFAAFAVLRRLHELLWYLAEAGSAPAARPVHVQARRALLDVEDAASGTPAALLALDVEELHRRAVPLLRRAGELVRARALAGAGRTSARRVRGGSDLLGADLRGADLRGADLGGAHLIAADLRDADLRGTCLIGADLRDADLRGADLRGAVFLTPFRIAAARGDSRTRIPQTVPRPRHWSA